MQYVICEIVEMTKLKIFVFVAVNIMKNILININNAFVIVIKKKVFVIGLINLLLMKHKKKLLFFSYCTFYRNYV